MSTMIQAGHRHELSEWTWRTLEELEITGPERPGPPTEPLQVQVQKPNCIP